MSESEFGTEQYDVLIAGGGMVGASLACALGNSGLKVALIEPADFPQAPAIDDPYGLRVSAITLASQCIFQNLGVWDTIKANRISPFREMHTWDAGGDGRIHFDSAEIGEATLGHIIENQLIQAALYQRCRDFENIDIIQQNAVQLYEVGEDQVDLQLKSGMELKTRLLVGADGRDSDIRKLAGIATTGWEYQQTAVVASVTPEKPHQETAWQRFLSSGPLAFLPLGNGDCSIVWSTTPDEANRLLELPEDEFCQQLEDAFESKLGKILHTGSRAAFPLRLQHATDYVKPRIALVGDAAHAIHPLAGQGVNLGLLDAATLAEVLLQSVEQGKDPGAYGVLRRYERWRKGENLSMMFAMDGFKKVFGSDIAPVRLLRNMGLNFADQVVPLKNQIMIRAMGLQGDFPALARKNAAAAFDLNHEA
ncbi:MAG: UbiH/UbiF/VisC/COQ6 family ubiquinone biosynthesis hydroxylase [Gammaproteobacteria bacterium]|nr:UbiH/UbiF/VisC/COQ6 family ubiquinone biosynthesis hydroxylase [Gammaproteobacteria bacterium]